MLTVKVNGEKRQYAKGTAFEEIAREFQESFDHTIVLVIEGGKIKELHKTLQRDSTEILFLTRRDKIGYSTYVRSATLLLVKAIHDVVGNVMKGKIKVEFSLGPAYYCSVKGDFQIDDALIGKIKERMQKLVEADLPITKKAYPIDKAREIIAEQGMEAKEQLFWYRRSSYVNLYCLEDYYDYNYGYMVPSTGYINQFELESYKDGLLLILPTTEEPNCLSSFEPREKLFDTLMESTYWAEDIGVNTVGELNRAICEQRLQEVILMQEALQERKIAEIASEIAARGNVKFVMIAGPSSSGKTTFSHRLSVQLMTHGLKPHPIAVDDYFVNREQTPRDEKGDYNFECLEAIDVEQFNRDMCDLLDGKTVEIPSFNFKTGTREYKGDYKTLGAEDILVIEGIHGLNDKMSYALPKESKFKIYISALTCLNVDEHNRIPTTDGRLLRRMVRDARTRGTSAKRTLQMWGSVRRGEEENIFPYQESADAMFNSATLFELAMLKIYAEPLLFGISKEEPEYFEAKRLLKFLGYFLGVSSEELPMNSIVREFVGGSCFKV
ncbi:MAG: nucleoside kinase [Lachnospiraceae bacterium]|nr:nucleoside kinase [Lachnospiraceae bacterium]MDY5700852.1 nucleoside kinase [Lachnospiraceae bacterium]